MDKHKLLAMLQTHATKGLRAALRAAQDGWAPETTRYHFERINALLAELDKVMQGEQEEPLIAQLNASVKGRQK